LIRTVLVRTRDASATASRADYPFGRSLLLFSEVLASGQPRTTKHVAKTWAFGQCKSLTADARICSSAQRQEDDRRASDEHGGLGA
jgi:hypothetical protein